MPVRRAHPQPRVRSQKSTRVSHHRFAETAGIPCTTVLRLIPCSLRRSGSLSPSLAKHLANFAFAFVSCASTRPSYPAPNVRDDREAPLSDRARDARKCASDLPVVTSAGAATHWHDGQITLCAQNLSRTILYNLRSNAKGARSDLDKKGLD